MGRSRRERIVALTKTRKHMLGRDKKQEIIQEIRDNVDKYANLYVFSTQNMRNALLKNLRGLWKDSRFFFGRKRVIQISLGRSEEEEYLEGLHKVSDHLHGNVGLLFTNRNHTSVVKFFDEYSENEFARSGFEATGPVELDEGPLEQFEPNQVQNLRLIGLPVDVKKGVVTLLSDFPVCAAGEVLTPEKAKILEFIGIRMAKFCIKLRCHYQKNGRVFEELSEESSDSVQDQ